MARSRISWNSREQKWVILSWIFARIKLGSTKNVISLSFRINHIQLTCYLSHLFFFQFGQFLVVFKVKCIHFLVIYSNLEFFLYFSNNLFVGWQISWERYDRKRPIQMKLGWSILASENLDNHAFDDQN